ncbi:MAG: diaminopimelate decarboxylase [Acidobacteria bacterium]|nr:diaminopimelate decarboxylase [Acidobacteriota bacterium]
MHDFHYQGGHLCCEGVPLERIAEEVGTPCYVYSRSALEKQFRRFGAAFAAKPHLTCFAVKANSNLSILRFLSRLGSGFDVVSGGELYRVLKAGADPGKVVFSGVGKSPQEILEAMEAGILLFNAESPQELDLLESLARGKRRVARVSLRVNPDVDPKTHPYTATGLRQHKFGIPAEEAPALARKLRSSRWLRLVCVGCHIGSQITELGPFVDAVSKIKKLWLQVRDEGSPLRFLDVGGGLGITYGNEHPPELEEYASAVLGEIGDLDCTLLLEPGRVIVGNAGVLLTRVLYTKSNREKLFSVVDAAMNDLIRPSLYNSFHQIWPESKGSRPLRVMDVVGPVCESGDFFARDRRLPQFRPGELVALLSAGAYGFVFASNYNSRPRAAEVLVHRDRYRVIRRRETYGDLIRPE